MKYLLEGVKEVGGGLTATIALLIIIAVPIALSAWLIEAVGWWYSPILLVVLVLLSALGAWWRDNTGHLR